MSKLLLRMLRGVFLGPCLAVLLLGAQSNPARAQIKVRISQAEYNLTRLPLYVALLKGYFKDEGLDCQLLVVNSGPNASKMLAGGALEFVAGPPLGVLQLRAQGIDAKIISDLSYRGSNSIVVQTSKADQIKSMKDIAGPLIGITGVGSQTWQWVIILAKAAGVDTNGLKFVSLGGSSIVGAFTAGRIDVLSYADPEPYELVASGQAKFLVDLSDVETQRKFIGDKFLFGIVAAMTDYTKAHPDVVQKFANALQRAFSWIDANKGQATADLLENSTTFYKDSGFNMMKHDLLMAMLKRSEPAFPPDGTIDRALYENTTKYLSMVSKDIAPYQDAVDNSFAAEAARKYPAK